MRPLIRQLIIYLGMVWISAAPAWAAPAGGFDFSGWDALLQRHVRPTTLHGVRLHAVAYPALKQDKAWPALISGLEKFSPDSLKARGDKLAFWINVYNILAVKMVLDHYPLDSIKDAGGLLTPVWDQPAGSVGGRPVTLGQIEHEILRKLGEPRIHVAIVCASVSCPDLRREAYLPGKLDAQLDDQMRRFLENRGKGLRAEGDAVYLSSIFKWFEEDFEARGGVRAYLAPYAPPPARAALKEREIEYLDYDWSLNKL